ncbi:MAG: chromate efflux transporter [Gemmatimonadaceae bacterium]
MTRSTSTLTELAVLFLRLGATSFGGPVAHIAMMEDEVVHRRAWLTREAFLDLVGATNLIPGPNSTELAMHVGHQRAGWRGLVVSGVAFILPAAILVGVLAWGYVRYGSLPAVLGVLRGMKPVVLIVVLQALYRLGRTALRTPVLVGLAIVALAAVAAGVNELLVLLLCGVSHAAATVIGSRRGEALPLGYLLAVAPSGMNTVPYGVGTMFLFFVKTGAVLFGSGYVLIALLRADFVERLGWITQAQLFDAITIGQATPGPVFTAATFVGYLLGGVGGATAATIGIFLPAFIFVAVSGTVLPRLRTSPEFRAGLAGVNVASLALMAVVAWQLGRSSVVDVPTAALAALTGWILLRFQLNSMWLVLMGALAGVLFMHT